MKTAAEEDVCGALNMAAEKRVESQVHLSDVETEATTWNIADTDCMVSQLERDINHITSNQQMRFNKELSIRMIKFEAWWQAFGVQELWTTIQ